MTDTPPKDAAGPQRSMPRFFVIWFGQAFSLMGSQLVQFALVWHLTEQTGSATVLALAMMMAVLPQVFVGPFAGAIIDRWDRRLVMILSDAAIALGVVVLVVLFALDIVRVWHIYVLMFLRATGGAFHWPATQAATTMMVPQKHLSRVAGLNQSLYGLANIVSPPLGALLLAALPMQWVLSVDIITAALAIAPLLFIPIPRPPRRLAQQKAGAGLVLTDLREALVFLRGWTGMLLVLVVAMVINMLLTPAMSLQPLLVTNHLGGGALQLAWLQSAFGLGLVGGGLTLSVWGGFRRRTTTGLLALTLMGAGIMMVGLVPRGALTMAIGAMFFAAFMSPIANGSLFALMQATVPPEMQGRVFTLMLSGSTAISPLGLLIAGPLADALGVQAWFIIAGIAMMILGVGALFVRPIMDIEDHEPQPMSVPAERTGEDDGRP